MPLKRPPSARPRVHPFAYRNRSPDMILVEWTSQDNGVIRPAIAFHRRASIGFMVDMDDAGSYPLRQKFQTTVEFDEWAVTVMNLPGLYPRPWNSDPVWAEYRRQQENVSSVIMSSFAKDYLKENGPKRMILVFDNEDQCLMFKMRWQDEPLT